MIDWILGGLTGIWRSLLQLLPDSPIQDWIEGSIHTNEQIMRGLGWLNWLFPVSDALSLLGVFLALIASVKIALSVVRAFDGAKDVFLGE